MFDAPLETAQQQSGGHAPATPTQRYLEYDCAADGTRAAAAGNGDFGTSPICGQLSGTHCCPYSIKWRVARKVQGQVEK
jgi:hypothetical protein